MLQTKKGGNSALFPLSWSSHKQASTSSSMSEAETVAMSTCLRSIALPLQHLLSACLACGVDIAMYQDNTVAQQVVDKGYSGQMRSILRTQRIYSGVLSELFGSECVTGRISHDRVKPTEQLADIFTTTCASGLALPSFAHDDVDANMHGESMDESLLRINDEHIDLVVPGPALDIEGEAPMPLEDDLDDTQARKLRREAFTFEHSMAHRTNDPLVRVILSLLFRLIIHSPMANLVIRDIVSSWRFAIAVNTKSSNDVVNALKRVTGARTTYKVRVGRPSEHDHGKWYLAVFLPWVILPGKVHIVLPWATLRHAIIYGTWRGWRSVRRVGDYYSTQVLPFPVTDLHKTFKMHQNTLDESMVLDPKEMLTEEEVLLAIVA
eukprot:6455056-Amphidinium_carterae.8